LRINARQPERGGFTLIELLVVIAIIALLVSLLAVGLNAVLTSSRSRVAQVTARNLGVAANSFEREFGFAPPLLHDGAFDAAVPGSMGTVDGPVVRRGDPPLNTDAAIRLGVPGVAGASRYFTPAYLPALNRRFLRGDDDITENNLVAGRYDFMLGASTDTTPRRNSNWTVANQRYSKHTLTYMLIGAGPAMIDGVDGQGMVAPDRAGVFPDVRVSGSAAPLAAAATASINVRVLTADRFPPFFSPSASTPITQEFADETEWFENGAAAAETALIQQLRDNRELPFSIAMTDDNGKAYRFYRWTPDEDPRSSAALNIPAVLIDPLLMLEFTNAAGPAERLRIDLTGGDSELRGARWAIVGAGPNGVFGTERVLDLERALARPIDETDPDAVAELRRQAWDDNAVELGR